MTSAARRAAAEAATSCHVPALAPPPAGRRAQGAAPNAPGTSPAPQDCARPAIRGGGAAAPAAVASTPNPAIAALAGMLGDAAAPERGPSVAQQLQLQVTSLLGAIGARLAALMPDGAGGAAATGLANAAGDAGDGVRPDPSQLLRQPPPPPIGPVLTLDPALGVIVDPTDPSGEGDGDGRQGGTGALDDPGLPSSWVPVPGGALRRVRERLGSVADRIDALLAEVGMTRLQLLLLMALGPVAVAFAIDVVSQLLDARG